MTDHGLAAAEMLERIAKLLREGEPPEDIGWLVVLAGRMMERKI